MLCLDNFTFEALLVNNERVVAKNKYYYTARANTIPGGVGSVLNLLDGGFFTQGKNADEIIYVTPKAIVSVTAYEKPSKFGFVGDGDSEEYTYSIVLSNNTTVSLESVEGFTLKRKEKISAVSNILSISEWGGHAPVFGTRGFTYILPRAILKIIATKK